MYTDVDDIARMKDLNVHMNFINDEGYYELRYKVEVRNKEGDTHLIGELGLYEVTLFTKNGYSSYSVAKEGTVLFSQATAGARSSSWSEIKNTAELHLEQHLKDELDQVAEEELL